MPGLRQQVEASHGAATPWGTAHFARHTDGRCAVPWLPLDPISVLGSVVYSPDYANDALVQFRLLSMEAHRGSGGWGRG
jgi:hypothetical protein